VREESERRIKIVSTCFEIMWKAKRRFKKEVSEIDAINGCLHLVSQAEQV